MVWLDLFSSNFLGNKTSLFGVEGEIQLILLAFALHGNKDKAVHQLYTLKARNHSNSRAVKKIDNSIMRFKKLKSFRFL